MWEGSPEAESGQRSKIENPVNSKRGGDARLNRSRSCIVCERQDRRSVSCSKIGASKQTEPRSGSGRENALRAEA